LGRTGSRGAGINIKHGKGMSCMAKKKENIKVEVVFTEGYEKRFTEAYLKVLEAREKRKFLEPPEITRGRAVNE